MDASPSVPTPLSVSTYVADGARIAAILLVWGSLAAFFSYGLTEIGSFAGTFEAVGGLLALTGVLNAVLYLLYRTVDYWQSQRGRHAASGD